MSNNGIIRLVKNAYGGIARLVFPPTCVFCGIDLQSEGTATKDGGEDASCNISADLEHDVCRTCIELLRPNYSANCLACGAGLSVTPANTDPSIGNAKTIASDGLTASNPPFENDRVNLKTDPQFVSSCIHCRRLKTQFRMCYSLGNYEKGIRDAVLRIKAGSSNPLAAMLAKLLSHKISGLGSTTAMPGEKSQLDLVVPIPIFWRRRLTRATIVSELIAMRIGHQLKIRYDRNVLRYNRLTKKQGTLSNTERTKNVAGAIELVSRKKVESKTILIVDDVMTSGATLNEASKVCLQAGAREVHVAIVARGIGLSLSR